MNPKKSFVDSLMTAVRKPISWDSGIVYNTASPFKKEQPMAPATQQPTTSGQGVAPLKPYSFDRDNFKKRIAHVESRGTFNPYKAIGITQDIGKYQVSPDTLNEWSEPWLDNRYTPEEYIKNPQAQEEFMKQYLDMVENYQLTPEEAAITWHRGWGALGNQADKPRRREIMEEQKKRYMAAPENFDYLNNFRSYEQ